MRDCQRKIIFFYLMYPNFSVDLLLKQFNALCNSLGAILSPHYQLL